MKEPTGWLEKGAGKSRQGPESSFKRVGSYGSPEGDCFSQALLEA